MIVLTMSNNAFLVSFVTIYGALPDSNIAKKNAVLSDSVIAFDSHAMTLDAKARR